ncbi:MAG: PhoH family protein [Deltaproteobacteria bacterium]|nr:PhoH family protein [Deltaproteobacteria bacterium]
MENKKKKIFVLDTSVIIYDHLAINEFQDNDVAIPLTVLEELDNFKKGSDTKNFVAREFIRYIDRLSKDYMLQDWIPLEGRSRGRFKVIYGTKSPLDAEKLFDGPKADHKILNAALALQAQEKNRKVILVTKDIALRLKAKSLNLPAEDYETGKIKDVGSLPSGKSMIQDFPDDAIDEFYRVGRLPADLIPAESRIFNHYLILRNGKKSALAFHNASEHVLEKINKRSVSRIEPRNAEQIFAIHALLRPEIRLVSLQGVAGTGKTLVALASALEQRHDFKQVFLARPIVPLGNRDIGYLPGDVKSKLNPYMEPLWDNLKFIKSQYGEEDKEYKKLDELVQTGKIEIAPLAYIRGRSLSNLIFIIDEAQNLTPHEVKTIITRAGENTKLIFTGDIRQIDTPYLDAQSNGLSYLIDRLRNQKLFAHITLEKGERSELANLASELL